MPGVPPDALAQVKKGFKGLFGRKKKDHAHAQQSTTGVSSTQHVPATADTNPNAGGAAGVDPRTQSEAEDCAFAQEYLHPHSTGKPGQAPQIAEPVNVSSSQNINLDPTAPSHSGAGEAAVAHTSTTQAAEETPDAKVSAEEVMSATSGPLSGDLGGGYGTETGGKKAAAPAEGKGTEALVAVDGIEPKHADTAGAAVPAPEAKAEVAEKGIGKPLPLDPTAKVLPVDPTAKSLPAEPEE